MEEAERLRAEQIFVRYRIGQADLRGVRLVKVLKLAWFLKTTFYIATVVLVFVNWRWALIALALAFAFSSLRRRLFKISQRRNRIGIDENFTEEEQDLGDRLLDLRREEASAKREAEDEARTVAFHAREATRRVQGNERHKRAAEQARTAGMAKSEKVRQVMTPLSAVSKKLEGGCIACPKFNGT